MKHPWNTTPEEPLALRDSLPRFKPETVRLLLAWAARQPAAGDWLAARVLQYREKLPAPATADFGRQAGATAALDLARWQWDAYDAEVVTRLDALEHAAGIPWPATA